jgi:peptide/nickel transport system substrate-binding protein
MRKVCLLVAVLLLAFPFPLALGQGYPDVPADALVIPLGVENTSYASMEQGVQGGTLHTAVIEDPRCWNDVISVTTGTGWVTDRMHRGLLSYNPTNGETLLDLAKRRELSEDNLVLTFWLREGLRWSDGEPITADDVLFTFNDLILNDDVACSFRDMMRLPDGTFPVCEKVDSHAVRFTLSTVFRPFMDILVFDIMPEHKLAQFVHRLNPAVPRGTFNETWSLDTPLNELVGNGPYLPVQYEPSARIVLERNPYYHCCDASGTQLPYFDRVVAYIVPNRDTALLKFLNSEIDVYALRPEDIPILLPQGPAKGFDVMLTDLATYGTTWIMINQDIGLSAGSQAEKRELYRKSEFREALAHLLDRETMVRNVLNGLGKAQWSPVSAPSPFYAGRDYYGGPITEGGAVWFEYDRALAARMLDALGVVDQDGDGWRDLPSGDPLTIEINTNDNTTRIAYCLIMVDDMRAVGLNAIFQAVDFNTLVGRLFASTFDILQLGLTGGDDPHAGATPYSSCGRLHAFRFTACERPDPTDLRIDELLRLGVATYDVDEAFAYYAEFQQLVARQLGYIFLVQPTFQYAFYTYVGNASLSSPIATPDAANGVLGDFCFDRRLLPPRD